MRGLVRAPVKVLVFTVISGFWLSTANAHSWYPRECCHGRDCAPVDKITLLISKDGNVSYFKVSSQVGTAIIPYGFPVRESKDGRIHICIRYDPFGDKRVICLFMPPNV